MKKEDLQYIAGVIDSEGSLDISVSKSKGYVHYYPRIRIKTTDSVIVPHISKLLDKKHETRAMVISVQGQRCVDLIDLIRPYLLVKARQADKLIELQGKPADDELKLLNSGYVPRAFIPEYEITYPWLAGMIDGDGSIYKCVLGRNQEKRALTIGLTDLEAMVVMANFFGLSLQNTGEKRPIRNQCQRVRLLSQKILEHGPHILPHLTLKKAKMEEAINFCLKKSSHTGFCTKAFSQ